MTPDQLKTWLDAHGVPGVPTEAGVYAAQLQNRAIVVVYCEADGSVWHGENMISAREILRHAPLPDPTALRHRVGELEAEVEALRHRTQTMAPRPGVCALCCKVLEDVEVSP